MKKYETCNTCGNSWSKEYDPHELGCDRCREIKNRYPEILDWVQGVIQEAIDTHTSKYVHEHHSEW